MSFPSSMFENRGLLKLGRLFREDLDISLWCSSFAEKLTVSGGMYLVADMYIDVKSKMRPNNLGMPFPLLYLS